MSAHWRITYVASLDRHSVVGVADTARGGARSSFSRSLRTRSHTSGNPGNYTVTDTQTNPGARCYYPGVNQSEQRPFQDQDLRTTHVRQERHPVGRLAVLSPARNNRRLGRGWTTYYKSPVMKTTATTSHAAAFSTQTWIAGQSHQSFLADQAAHVLVHEQFEDQHHRPGQLADGLVHGHVSAESRYLKP